MAESTTIVRDILLTRRGVVPMADLQHIPGADEAGRWLVDAKLAIYHNGKRGIQALDGMERPVERCRRVVAARREERTPGVDKAGQRFEVPSLAEGSARIAATRRKARQSRLPDVVAAVRDSATLKAAFAAAGFKSYDHIRNYHPDEWAQVQAAFDEVTARRMEEARCEAERVRGLILSHLRATGGDTVHNIAKISGLGGYSKYRLGALLSGMRAAGLVTSVQVSPRVAHWRIKPLRK